VIDRGLERWGASPQVIAALERLRSSHFGDGIPGRVSRVDRTGVRVVSNGDELRSNDGGLGPLCVGDWVLVACGPSGRNEVLALLERRSTLTRSTGAGSTPQLLAANIDDVLIAVALDQPADASRMERLLTLARDSGAAPRVLVTKSDLGGGAELVRSFEAIGPGVPVTSVSVRSGAGIDDVAAELSTGRTAALIGASGAGKSSLINALIGSDRLQVGAVRSRDGKGRHTTSWRELVALPGGGVVIDTPGIRSLGLWLDEGGIDATFSEISGYAGQCKFSDCVHGREPGCAVLAAVASGALDERRLQSFFKLQEEADLIASRNDARAAREDSREAVSPRRDRRPRSHPR
jgi:ribosome biogenesis GTPase